LLGEESTVSTNLRVAAGACALSIGLLVASGGGAMAVADTGSESGGAASHSESGETSGTGSSATRSAAGQLADSLRRTLQNTFNGVTSTLNSLGKAPQRAGANSATTPPTMKVSASPTVLGSLSTAPSTEATATEATATEATATEATATEPTATAAPVEATPVQAPAVPVVSTATPTTPAANTNPAEAVAPVADPPVTTLKLTGSDAVAPDPGSAVTTPTTSANASAPPATKSTWLGPVSTSLAAVVNSVAAVPAVVVSLPTSTTPVHDIVNSIANMLTSVANVGTSFTQLNLSQLLGASAVAPPTIGGAAGHHPAPVAVAGVPNPAPQVPSLSEILLPVAGPGDGQASDAAAAPAQPVELTAGAGSRAAATSEVPLAAQGADGNDTLSTVERVIGAFVASASITALAAIALPGIGGLLATCAAGIRIGYRNAKAGASLPAVITRFAGSGPLGVVRSGAQVQLHRRTERPQKQRPRALRVVEAEPSAGQRVLEEAV
jgi:hypothetical protein